MSRLQSWPPDGRLLELALTVLLVTAVLVGVDRFVASLPSLPAPGPAPATVRSGALQPVAQDPFPSAPRTFRGPVHGIPDYSPTADKPQSKLWHHDGSWWALMVSAPTGAVHVFQLSEDLRAWRDTGTVVDSRPDSRGDALAVGDLTYVASRGAGHIALAKLVYDRARRSYTQAAGFPVPVVAGASDSVTVTRDSRERLWMTYQQRRRVHVLHSTSSDREWTQPFAPGVVYPRVSADDISTILAVNGAVAVMWSDQAGDAFRFALHADAAPDDVWRLETPLAGENVADDHISATVTAQGRVLAVVKTSNDDDLQRAGEPGVQLLVREPGGAWSAVPVTTAGEDWTRPVIAVDETHGAVLVFATSATGGGSIVMHCASLSRLDFSAGRPQSLIDPHDVVTNATGAKSPVSADTGLVVLASTGVGEARYYYAALRVGEPAPDSAPGLEAAAGSRRPCARTS